MSRISSILLPNWEPWDNGVSDLPAKDVTLLSGEQGCIILNEEGISVYSRPLEIVNDEDMGDYFINIAENDNETNILDYILEKIDIEEAKSIFKKYLEYHNSYRKG